MRIQSIPAVFAFVDGQPVDGFMGALPESNIKQFIDRLGSQGNLAEQIEAAVAAGREALAAQSITPRLRRFLGQVLGRSGECRRARRFRECQIEPGELDRATATLAKVPPAKANDPEVVSVKAALDLALNPVDTSLDQLPPPLRTPLIIRRA